MAGIMAYINWFKTYHCHVAKAVRETRFMTAELFKSKLNISAEMDENGSIKATDVIKTITGCDLLTERRKERIPFNFIVKPNS